jgi:glutamate racemase
VPGVASTEMDLERDYTRALIHEFASDCDVTLVGAPRLAGLAEAALRGEAIADADIAQEIAPAFVERAGRRTDAIVLACTHFPLLQARLAALAPWSVEWVDPAPAIARRVDALLGPATGGAASRPPLAFFTSGAPAPPALLTALLERGLTVSS